MYKLHYEIQKYIDLYIITKFMFRKQTFFSPIAEQWCKSAIKHIGYESSLFPWMGHELLQ